MPPHQASPHNPHVPVPTAPVGGRLPWDMVAIVGVGALVAVVVVAWILLGDPTPAPASTAAGAAGALDAAAAPEADADAPDFAQALGLVGEAQALLEQGRFDEAADRLAMVTAYAEESGAIELAARLEQVRSEWTALRAQLDADVAARRWEDAERTLVALEQLAPLDNDLQAIAATVQQALAPAEPAVTTSTTTTAGDAAAVADEPTVATTAQSTSGGGSSRPGGADAQAEDAAGPAGGATAAPSIAPAADRPAATQADAATTTPQPQLPAGIDDEMIQEAIGAAIGT